MPMFHEKFRPMLLRRNRIVLSDLHNLDITHIKFVSTWRALVGTHRATDTAGTFECQALCPCKYFLGHIFLEHYALNSATAITQPNKNKLALLSFMCNPTGKGDRLTCILGD